MSRQFKKIYKAVNEILKDTQYLVVPDINEEEYKTLGFKKSDFNYTMGILDRWWGNKIFIIDPLVQKPRFKDNVYSNYLISITENYDDYEQYFLHREVSCKRAQINVDKSIVEEVFSTYDQIISYVNNQMLNDLHKLSATTDQLNTLVENLKLNNLPLSMLNDQDDSVIPYTEDKYENT